ncbi:Helicase [Phytophthora megakarya]|uniref:ATP-dependent DNA helicase n=1 Tax=Phytophthora megakarya TaxID=4795 RepID=A0A225W2Z1_9STRA|nr:Helicase [Phytophthora megakarya]
MGVKSTTVVTAAYQDIAAQNVRCQIFHYCFGWRVNNHQIKRKPNVVLVKKIHKVKMLIIDEISTSDIQILRRMDSSLRIFLKRPLLRFGGLHILLGGAWLQQLPVAEQSAYLQISRHAISTTLNESTDSVVYLDRVRDAEAYPNVNIVVMLSKNMRH